MQEFLISEIAALNCACCQLWLLIMEYCDYIVHLISVIPQSPLSIPTH